MNTWVDIANQTIPKSANRKVRLQEQYNTGDIIQTILKADKKGHRCVEKFVRAIPAMPVPEFLQKLWDLVHFNIKYQEDGREFQAIKTPAALWDTRVGDCKSFSVFIASCLKVRGISYSYRFVSFGQFPIYTHVYVVAHYNGASYILDAVPQIPKFNYEKPYTHKKDYKMKGLYMVSGVGNAKPGILYVNPDKLTPEMIDAAIIKQRLEVEKQIVDEIRGIGNAKSAAYQRAIDVMNGFIGALESDDFVTMEGIISGIGEDTVGKAKSKATLKKIATSAKKTAAKKKPGLKNIVKKAASAAKKVVKTGVKLVTAPARLAAKTILSVMLPKAAPAFLYLFINDPKILAKVPEKVRKKRAKQVKIADFIVNVVGMKRDQLMGIVRNGIMKRYKKSPEAIIAEKFKISGVGFVMAAAALIGPVIEIIKKIASVFGKKPDEDPKGMEPDDSDFITAAPGSAAAKKLAAEIKSQPAAFEPGDTIDAEGGGGLDNAGGRKLFGIC